MKRKSTQLAQKCTRTKVDDWQSHSRQIRICTLQQAVRFVMKRQGLVQRLHIGSLKQMKDTRKRSQRDPAVALNTSTEVNVDNLMPLHATAQTTAPLSLLARVHQFQEQHLDTFLTQSRMSPLHYPLLPCMRGTLHLVPANKHHLITGIYNSDKQMIDQRFHKFGMSTQEFQFISKKIIHILSSNGPMLTQQLTVLMKAEEKPNTKYKVRSLSMQAGKFTVTQSTVSLALHALFGQAQVQHGLAAPPSSSASASSPLGISPDSWRETRRMHGIATLASSSSVNHEEKEVEEEEEEENVQQRLLDLMRWYFELYSPATLKDFVWWSGRKVRESRTALETLQACQEVKEIHVRGLSSAACVCFVWAAHEDSLLASEDSLPRGVRFLPYEDALIKAYKETRHRFYFHPSASTAVARPRIKKEIVDEDIECEDLLPNESMQQLTFRNGEAYPTLWIDGQIVGRWKWKNTKKTPTTANKTKTKTKETIRSTGQDDSGSSSAVITITTEQAMPKKVQNRLSVELGVLCDLLECCSRRDVEFTTETH